MKILDKFLPLWIFLSATFGLILGIYFPQIVDFYQLLEFNDINLALALGDKELALSLVAFNSLFQIFFFGIMAYIFMIVLPSFLGINLQGYTLSFALVAKNVAIYLGIPFILGFLTRFILVKYKGAKFYEENFIAKISPITLIFLLYIVSVMFSYKGESLLKLPLDTLLVALPLVAYFVVMFFIAFYLSKGFGYEKACAISFSACGNNFELSLAVAIASFGINSPQAFVSIVGVLVEVPVMLFLVNVLKTYQFGKYFA